MLYRLLMTVAESFSSTTHSAPTDLGKLRLPNLQGTGMSVALTVYIYIYIISI